MNDIEKLKQQIADSATEIAAFKERVQQAQSKPERDRTALEAMAVE